MTSHDVYGYPKRSPGWSSIYYLLVVLLLSLIPYMGCKATSTVLLVVVGGDTRHVVHQEMRGIGEMEISRGLQDVRWSEASPKI